MKKEIFRYVTTYVWKKGSDEIMFMKGDKVKILKSKLNKTAKSGIMCKVLRLEDNSIAKICPSLLSKHKI